MSDLKWYEKEITLEKIENGKRVPNKVPVWAQVQWIALHSPDTNARVFSNALISLHEGLVELQNAMCEYTRSMSTYTEKNSEFLQKFKTALLDLNERVNRALL